MKKNILFNFQQMGGANALLPLIEHLEKTNNILITGRSLVCDNLAARNIPVKRHGELKSNGFYRISLSKCFNKFKPDILITDTIDLNRAPESIVCRSLWSCAKKESIPSVAYVDCWWGYDKRFLFPGELSPPAMPDGIAVIDEMARTDMINAGYDPIKITALGNPWFETLCKMNKNISDTPALRKELNLLPDNFIILFVSQPLEKTFNGNKTYGFTEKNTLSALLESLNKLPQATRKAITLVILLHPEEDDSISKSVIIKANIDLDIRIKKNNQHKLVRASNLVTGMFSMLLAEAVLLQRPVISIQLHLKKEEILITNKIGATKSVNTIDRPGKKH